MLDGSGITEVKYEETEHYTITKHFLNNYERQLQILMGDADA
jgi:predicted ATPase